MEITNLIRKGLQLGVGFSMFIGSMATLSLIPGVGGIFSSIGTTLSGLYSSPIIGGLLATFGSIGGILLVLYIGTGFDPLGFGTAIAQPGAVLEEGKAVIGKVGSAVGA